MEPHEITCIRGFHYRIVLLYSMGRKRARLLFAQLMLALHSYNTYSRSIDALTYLSHLLRLL